MRVYANEKFKSLGREFTAPRFGDAGYDLYTVEPLTIPAKGSAKSPTGLHFEIPSGWVGVIFNRSSVAFKLNVESVHGVIDSSYRGEVWLKLHNLNDVDIQIQTGTKIAQMLILPHFSESVVMVDSLDELSETLRGERGFGSTGK